MIATQIAHYSNITYKSDKASHGHMLL